MRTWGILALAAVSLLLLVAVQSLPPLRGTDTPIATHVDGYYTANAPSDMETPNLVTAILGDYRGYDTFGETTVVFAAGLSCYLLLRRMRG